MNFPAPGFSRKCDLNDARRFSDQALDQAELLRRVSNQSFGRLVQHAFARAIHKPKQTDAVEREYGDVDFFHHLAQQRRRLESAQPLLPQRFAKRVHLAQHFAQDVVSVRAARANRKVTFAQSGEKIRECAKREYDAILRAESEAQPRHDHERP